jgi:hypothetical protein
LSRCNSDPFLYVRKEKSEFVITALMLMVLSLLAHPHLCWWSYPY